ncbi:alpha-L-fucosidase [Clostridium sp.]|uniref:alpha-L-fucosidase n=1 Tax=Clostridium sp. TaxID=1506 RepID=UPI00261D49EA|nr:alpha-L-fucosidase [Clostridium sp.]
MLKPEKRIKDFEEMAFGMFIHWGLYSIHGKGEWAKINYGISDEDYYKSLDEFKADKFDASNIAKIASKAGMKYIILTTKHHDGFCLYDSRGLTNLDVNRSAAKRDLILEFVNGCRENGIKPFLYHSTVDWYDERYKKDFEGAYLDYLRDSVELLCREYGEIGGLWFDGNWDKPSSDWKLDELYGTIRKYQPNAMIINNTGLSNKGEICHKEVDSVTFEQGLPELRDKGSIGKYISSEMCQPLNEHWGIAIRDVKYKSTKELIENLCACRKVGSNYLLNIGPNGDGSIPKIQEGILEEIGKWMAINGEAIYKGRPCEIESKGKNFALKTEEGKVYLFIHDLDNLGDSNVVLKGEGPNVIGFKNFKENFKKIKWLDNNEELKYVYDEEKRFLKLHTTGFKCGNNLVVRVAEVL